MREVAHVAAMIRDASCRAPARDPFDEIDGRREICWRLRRLASWLNCDGFVSDDANTGAI